MDSDGDANAGPFKALLLHAVEGSGIAEDRIQVEYLNELQDYEVRVSGALTDEQIEQLRRATRLGGCLILSDTASELRLTEAERREGVLTRARAAELARDLVGLPQFNPSQATLASFAVELEAYCGFKPGQALQALDDKTLRVRVAPPVSFDHFQRLMDAVTAALAQHGDVQLVLTGRVISRGP